MISYSKIIEYSEELSINPSAFIKCIYPFVYAYKNLSNSPVVPRISFEGHIFYLELKKIMSKRELELLEKHFGHIVHKSFLSNNKFGGIMEYDRFYLALSINDTAAYMSTRWGVFQLLGRDYKKALLDTVHELVEICYNSTEVQLRYFINYITTTKKYKLMYNPVDFLSKFPNSKLLINISNHLNEKYHESKT